MVHVAVRRIRCAAACAAKLAVHGHEVDQAGPGTQLHQAEVGRLGAAVLERSAEGGAARWQHGLGVSANGERLHDGIDGMGICEARVAG